MEKLKIAVLLTCHNRKALTIASLQSLFMAHIPSVCLLEVYLTDDGCTDGTSDAVRELFPNIHLVKGNGNLYWAGGMRLAWKTAMGLKPYDAYLLINDDVILDRDFLVNLLIADAHSVVETRRHGLCAGATLDETTGRVTYGGSLLRQNHLLVTMQKLEPSGDVQRCDLLNANVLWVHSEAVRLIGIFDDRYTHGMADYDYSRKAVRYKIPLWLAPDICGVCKHDHGKNWMSSSISLKERIAWMKSPKGLAYHEYLYYVRRNFPLYLPYSFVMLWLKILFPVIWDKLKVEE